jgi:hypothetical protein
LKNGCDELKKYIVKWKNEQQEFSDPQKAIKFAEIKGDEGANAYVYTKVNGVLAKEPFFTNEWELY